MGTVGCDVLTWTRAVGREMGAVVVRSAVQQLALVEELRWWQSSEREASKGFLPLPV